MKQVRINGKMVDVEIRNGVRYIDGKTVEEYMKTLDHETLLNYAIVGKAVVDGKNISPQKMMDEFHQKKNN